jgi:hypothetical protein
LSKAGGKVDATKLAEVLPIKEVLSKAAAGFGMLVTPTRALTAKIQRVGYLYTLVKVHPFDKEKRKMSPLSVADADSVQRSLLTGGGGEDSSAGAITFQGNVKLPK